MPDEPLALAGVAARGVLSRSPFGSERLQALSAAQPAEAVAIERIEVAPAPSGRVDRLPPYEPRIDQPAAPRQAPTVKPPARR